MEAHRNSSKIQNLLHVSLRRGHVRTYLIRRSQEIFPHKCGGDPQRASGLQVIQDEEDAIRLFNRSLWRS